MSTIQYLGEHRWIGICLHAGVIIGFLACINAIIAYTKSVKSADLRWLHYARSAFALQALTVLSTIGLLFYAMLNHFYEYEYVRHHISDDLPFKYIFAAFWEGQEGSFLLWMFWNVVLGIVLIKTCGKWESPVMAVFCVLQVFLFSMILGLHFGWGEHIFKIGSSPSLLVRETFNAPLFQNPEYVKLIKGNGLNPLLQNYWMTIHPPTLFLGFASTIVPFLFAFAGWWKKDYKSWLKPAQEWALFSAFILGLGVLMGGAWAYEALSFGGYWAWDPVENMSLVPWIMMLAGLHTNMIARSTGRAIGTTYIFYLLSFVLVLYSSYMTRSGVLGNTSAHAFTDMGLELQLILLVLVFSGLGIYNYFKNRNLLTPQMEEEKIYSREYWMFIGAMILLFSTVLITGATSLPVFNKMVQVFNPDYTGQVIVDPISHHNRFQLWIAVMVSLLSGIAEFLRFKEVHWAEYKLRFLKLIGISLSLSVLLFILSYKSLEQPSWQHLVLQFTGLFAIVSNLTYLLSFLRGKIKLAGSAMAHLGFGIMVLGILATGLNKKIISTNMFAQAELLEGFSTEDYMRNLVLIKDAPMPIKEYEVTYLSDTLLNPFNRKFFIQFDKKDKDGRIIKKINSTPTLVYSRNENQGPSTNPSIHRSLTQDLYTYVNWMPPSMMNGEVAEKAEDSLKYLNYQVPLGDTFFYSAGYGVLSSWSGTSNHPDYKTQPGDQVLSAIVNFHRLNDTARYSLESTIVSRGNLYFTYAGIQNELGLKVKINPSCLDTYYPNDEAGSELELQEDGTGELLGYKIHFLGFNKNPDKNKYAALPDDIAVATEIEVTSPAGQIFTLSPLFIIRANQVFLVHDYVLEELLRLSCVKIDPQKESITLKLRKGQKPSVVSLDMAEKAPRNDMIVIQSILFPGINLFWLGSLTMLLGLLVSGIRRWTNR